MSDNDVFEQLAQALALNDDDGPEWTPPEGFTPRQIAELEIDDGEPVLGVDHKTPLFYKGDRCVVGAITGAGKSTLALAMAGAISEADELLGWKGCGDKVLYLDVEQGMRSIQKKIVQAGLTEAENIDYYPIPEGLDLNGDPRQFDWLRELIEEGEYCAVVCEPLYKMHRGDPRDERQMTDLMNKLDALRVEFNFFLLLTMHMRKPPSGAEVKEITIHDISGMGALVYGAEVVLGLEQVSGFTEGDPDSEGTSRLYWFKDRDGELPVGGPPWYLKFHRTRGYSKAADPKSIGKSTEERMKEVLDKAFPEDLTLAELSEGMARLVPGDSKPMARSAMKEALKRVKASGYRVKEVPNGRGRSTVYMSDRDVIPGTDITPDDARKHEDMDIDFNG